MPGGAGPTPPLPVPAPPSYNGTCPGASPSCPWRSRIRRSSGAFYALFAALPAPARAVTPVCGTLRLAQEWTAKESPYLVTSDLYLPNTSRLRIGPGVVVRFAAKSRPCNAEDPAPAPEDWSDSAYVGIRIEGPFQCLGTEENPVIFEPEKPGAAAVGWDGLRFVGQGARDAEIGFAVFRGANAAIQARKAGFFVHHTLFEGNNTGISLLPRGDLSIVNCAFLGNRSAGIQLDKARPRIAANIFAGNGGYGIRADGRLGLFVSHNAFWRNGEEDCRRCPHSLLPAGTSDTVPDAQGNLVADPVFEGSESHRAAAEADVATDTPLHLVKDKALARMEAEGRAKWSGSGPAPKLLGTGPYRLSRYSRLRDAGPPGTRFKDRDGSRSDIGLHGGPMGRFAEDPF